MTTAAPKPRAGEHTKGPWRVQDSTHYEERIAVEFKGRSLVLAHVFDGPEFGSQVANARRIVACVNACEGYPTEFLERGGLRSGIKGGAQSEDALRERERELVKLIEGHRDTFLLQALRDRAEPNMADGWINLSEQAKAILAKHGR